MSGDGGLLWNIKKEDTDDELSILAGHTRLVSTQRSRNPSPSRQYNPSPPLFPPTGQLKTHDTLDHISQPHLPLNVPSAYLQHTPPRLSHAPSTITDAWVSSSISSEPRAQHYQNSLGVDERLPSHYPYITSTAHHHQSESSLNTYGWSNDPRLQQHHGQSQRCVSSASSSSSSTAAHQLPSSHSQQQPMHSHQSPTNQSQHQLQHHNDHQPQYHGHAAHVSSAGGSPLDVTSSTHHSHVYADHQPHLLQDLSPPPSVRPHEHSNVYSMYGSSSNSNSRSSVYHDIHPHAQTTPGAAPNMDLAHLGLASRDSRLDDRWGSFMADSGLMEGSR